MLLPALGEAALPKDRLRALRNAVRGRVLTPGDSGYNGARVVFNTRWDGVKPPAVVQVRDTADVRAVVQWADRYDVPLVARSGGHGYSGNSTSDSAVVVDLDRLDAIRYRDGIATLGPGARLGAVYSRLAAPRRDDPRRVVPHRRRRRARAGRRDGPRRPRDGPHVRPRALLRHRRRRGPAPPRRRRRAVLGAARRRRELRHRHGRAAAHPQREHRRVLPHQLLPRGPRRGARALGRLRSEGPVGPDRDPHAHAATARPRSASTSAARTR